MQRDEVLEQNDSQPDSPKFARYLDERYFRNRTLSVPPAFTNLLATGQLAASSQEDATCSEDGLRSSTGRRSWRRGATRRRPGSRAMLSTGSKSSDPGGTRPNPISFATRSAVFVEKVGGVGQRMSYLGGRR